MQPPEDITPDPIASLALARCAKAQRDYLEAEIGRHTAIRQAIDDGCSYREIAQAMGLSHSNIYNLRHGRRRA